ncbi:D-alanyl-D-alanine carboxypeptidase family protein [Mangrovicoccus sp. HB161399]|uniref:D-alanyl-D-alanine carboxypeptidase family protein n=1 Tax=Mangrovicoccus sp. HB161399 TaxID=2720392 RepID=UPI0020A6B42D|nr:D-alanyl-D-alanine carboxypeptidase family protein [Mangrovicoccus sp. HB161399]
MDARTGEVLHSQNADTRLHPASLTKMMTLYVTFEAVEHGEISLDTKVRITKAAAAEPASKLYLKAGSSIELRYLIRAAAVKSANDAAHAIADAVGGSVPGFAARMNRTAKALGMKNTTFKNPHGLTTPGHLSTARDMSILGRHLFYDYPEYYNLFSRITTDAGVTTVANTNRRLLSSYRGADGIKTGYTNAAGSNLVASAERGGVRIIATVFGGSSSAARNKRVAELLDLGFRKAPKYAKVDKPHKPNYAIASARTVVHKSVVPMRRPDHVIALAAARSNIVIAEADIQEALEEAQAAPDTASSLPEEVVARSFVPMPRPDDLLPGQAAPADAATDMARAALADEEVEEAAAEIVATTAAVDTSEEEDTVEVAMAGTATDAPPAPAPSSAANGTPLRITIAKALGQAASPAAAEAAEAPVETAALAIGPENMERPEPRPAVTFSTSDMALEEDGGQNAAPVTVSTRQGPDSWGIAVGRYSTRWQAERVLLRTALQQVDLLGKAKRAVVSKPTGFEVQFVGLSEAEAQQTCLRLSARDERCSAFGS